MRQGRHAVPVLGLRAVARLPPEAHAQGVYFFFIIIILFILFLLLFFFILLFYFLLFFF